MSIASDPNEPLELTLTVDEGKPAEERPTFVFHYLTFREHKSAKRVWLALDDAADEFEAMDRLVDEMGKHLRGWRGVRGPDGEPLACDPARLPDVLNELQVVELYARLLAANRLQLVAAKNFVLQSPTDSDGSAPAVPDPAAAPIPQAATAPPASSAPPATELAARPAAPSASTAASTSASAP